MLPLREHLERSGGNALLLGHADEERTVIWEDANVSCYDVVSL